MFFSNRNQVGASSPEAAVEGYVDSIKKDDYVKAIDYFYYEDSELRKYEKNRIKETSKEDMDFLTKYYDTESMKKIKVLGVEEQTDTFAKVIVSKDGGVKYPMPTIKVDGRWYIGHRYPF